jgi:hypothetical protein
MSNPTSLLHDKDELEAQAAMLPVASEIDGDFMDDDCGVHDSSYSHSSSLPGATFDYDIIATAAASKEDEIFAVPLPQLNDIQASDHGGNNQRVLLAERSGRQHVNEEKDAIQRANLKGLAKSSYEEQQIRLANELAKQRDREGIQLRNEAQEQQKMTQLMLLHEKSRNEDQPQTHHSQLSPASGYDRAGGYQTKDYNRKDYSYDTNEYDISQYRSVYDS